MSKSTEIVRENEYMYIMPHSKKGWYTAKMKGLSVTQISDNLDKLEKDFTAYIKRTFFEK